MRLDSRGSGEVTQGNSSAIEQKEEVPVLRQLRAGIKNFRWHDLWANWHVQQGTPLHVLQELGGWSDFEMVRRYAHLSVEHLAEYAERLTENRLVSTNLAQSGNAVEKR